MRWINASALVLVGALFMLLSLTACGESDSSSNAGTDKAAERRSKKLAAAKRTAAACEGQLGPFLRKLQELDSRLSVGLNYSEYTEKVADVKVVYDRIPFDDLDFDCLSSVGTPGETALNQYAKAADRWGECVDDLDCSNESVQPELQKFWTRAGKLAARAVDGLKTLGQP